MKGVHIHFFAFHPFRRIIHLVNRHPELYEKREQKIYGRYSHGNFSPSDIDDSISGIDIMQNTILRGGDGQLGKKMKLGVRKKK